MKRTVAIGIQNFDKIIEDNCFYVDKTLFIKEWWENADNTTLITRPRRFGKTLNMSMLECFFSLEYADRGELFEGLSIWQEEKYRRIQGTYPVISMSFAKLKERSFETTRTKICQMIVDLYKKFSFIKDSEALYDTDRDFWNRVSIDMDDAVATLAIHQLSAYLKQYYGKKVIILLDEYDTPMQEAYIHGYWDELVDFTRSMFNAMFKSNPYMERGIMTGITRVSKESIFSDLNHLKVITTTSNEYATSFGFTEDEVFDALEEYGMGKEKENVKLWYDGFTFGRYSDIYNPWSILNFLDSEGVYEAYWANSSSNRLVNSLLREGNRKVKESFERLLKDEVIRCPIDEQIVYDQLNGDETAIWSLLLASGYLKVFAVERAELLEEIRAPLYDLALTNREVKLMFYRMVQRWFGEVSGEYSDFVKALLMNDIDAMNEYMNRVAWRTFSYFDTGKSMNGSEPERFYHGFVLGLIAELSGEYVIMSNRESGFGRYDVMMEPKDKNKKAVIMEFKVHNPRREASLEETVQVAHAQIEEKQYEAVLLDKGFGKEQIYKYGFAFEGKKVLIG